MKRNTIYILLLLVFVSCNDILDEVPKSFVSRANYYQTASDAEGAIAGAYSTFMRDYFGITYYLFEELHCDYINARGSQAPITDFSQVLDPTNVGRAATNWSTLYRVINRANAVLGNVPGIEMGETEKNRILGEAYFLRAMAYFNLVRYWGPVPLRLEESVDLSTVAVPRASESDVYQQIITDATLAESNLPESVGAQTGRASKWAAKMLLAEIYLQLEDWAMAAEKANDIIESNQFSLVEVKVADDFYKIFAVETSSEDIMSVHHSETSTSEIQIYIHRPNTPPYNYGSKGYYAWIPVTNSFIGDSWNDNDLRKSFNLYTQYQNQNGEWVDLPSSSPILFKKFISDPNGLNTYSMPIYRYTEAFLTYAEAKCMADETPSATALERLNMIKRRAYGYDPYSPSPVDYASGMSKEEFRDTVIQERAYEFLLERKRWWDLKRTGKVKQAISAIGKTFIDQRYLWPIPSDEINNNPEINQADQNPGY